MTTLVCIPHGMPADPPIFRLTLRLHDNNNTAIVRYQDEPGRFDQAQTLKLVSGEAYLLTVELEDLGSSVDGIQAVMLDDEELEMKASDERQDPASCCTVYTVVCQWKLSRLHFGPTPNGLRDYLPIEVVYKHAGASRELAFFMQAKMYSADKRRLRKAKDVGNLFKSATCMYDAAKDPQRSDRPQPQGLVASSRVTKGLKWRFHEAVESESTQSTVAAEGPPLATPRGRRGWFRSRPKLPQLSQVEVSAR